MLELLSVTFVDSKDNRRWTYDNVFKIEANHGKVYVTCKEEDGNGIYVNNSNEFTNIEIEKESNISKPYSNSDYIRDMNDDELSEWLVQLQHWIYA